MSQSVIQYSLGERSRLEAAGSLAVLFAEDLIFSAEYWMVRGAQAWVNLFCWAWRRPMVACSAFLLLGGSAVALNVRNQLFDAQEMTARLDLFAIGNAVDLYKTEVRQIPSRLEDLSPKYLKLHLDPWGRNYVLYRGPGGVAVGSAGPDGQLGTPDDIVKVLSFTEQALPFADEPALDAFNKLRHAKRSEVDLVRGTEPLHVVIDRASALERIEKP